MALLTGCGASKYEAAAPRGEAAAAPAEASAPAGDAPGASVAKAEASPAVAGLAGPSTRTGESLERGNALDRPIERVQPRGPAAGQLTAGVWDDNLNFGFFEGYAEGYQQRGGDFAFFDKSELGRARDTARSSRARSELDVQLVLDTTGSMGDELAYLQSELDSIATTLARKFPQVTPRWSLIVYRDHGDDYVTRQFDFTSDVARFRNNLREQSAGGGGDMPEAVNDAWQQSLQQSWRASDTVAKVAFWVADAPSHPGEGRQLGNLMRNVGKLGVHVYPVASSGVDDVAEYQMRSFAQHTGGRYVFLTDDSGIGNAHAEPHIPCYSVARLDQTLVRMVESELRGQHQRAQRDEVVRTVGQPDGEGRCQLQNRRMVASY